MVSDTTRKHTPFHRLAIIAFAVSLIAAAFALYGSFLSERHLADSPLNRLRLSEGLESTRESGPARIWVPVAAYAAPLVLGLAAALMGGEAIKAIERRKGASSGSGAAVFAIMIGGLSAVIAASMIFAVYGWHYIPSVYTY